MVINADGRSASMAIPATATRLVVERKGRSGKWAAWFSPPSEKCSPAAVGRRKRYSAWPARNRQATVMREEELVGEQFLGTYQSKKNEIIGGMYYESNFIPRLA